MPGHPHLVAEVEQLREREVALGQGVLAHVDLDAGAAVGQHQERRLPEAADADDAARHRGLDAGLIEPFGRSGRMRLDQLADGVGRRRTCGDKA
ncbi:MAG: hypothetical protein R2708_11105 [Vicinamibacterales bacterium]